jgi:hypothetical protein
MQPQQPIDLEALKAIEQRSLRESYECAGREAHALGVPRIRNPFKTRRHTGTSEADRLREDLLAAYWWAGWDQAAAAHGSPG